MNRIVSSAIGALLAASLLAVPAFAHSTGHESRTVAACEKLPAPERQNCLKCVTRPAKHHFHPDYPPGQRCRPDNGKP